MLGELYQPGGLARETAHAVLEVEEPYACNVALGCTNACLYCYVPRFMRKSREECLKIRLPKRPPIELVRKQLDKGLKPQGVFLSFLTDPLLPVNKENTEDLIRMLTLEGVRTATSSKLGIALNSVVQNYPVRHGMTVVSLDSAFWRKFEPNTIPPMERIKLLETYATYSWFAMEPYPVSAIWKQDITKLLEEIKFANLIIFGKWNYDKRANTQRAREEYAEYVNIIRDFCGEHGIKCHIKSDTLKFVEEN